MDFSQKPHRTLNTAEKHYLVRQAATVGRQAVVGIASPKSLPADLAFLPTVLSQLHRLHLYPPLSLVRDLLSLNHPRNLAKEGNRESEVPLKPLLTHKGIQALRQLQWPLAAHTGLLALLLRDIPLDDWQPPAELTPSTLPQQLTTALSGDAIEPQTPPAPIAALQQAANQIDERLLTLLNLLGPEAVATDPSLPLRLARRIPQLPPLSQQQRKLLGISLRINTSGSRAQGSGIGTENVGVTLHGKLSALLPSQLALPRPIFNSRHSRGELLYRARIGKQPPRLRPTIIVLDISPPSFGPIETSLRLAAHIIASSLLQAQLPVVLVIPGDIETVQPIEQSADLVEIWTQRRLKFANLNRVFSVARAMRETLHDGHLEPAIVLLTYAQFVADAQHTLPSGLRALFVQYPTPAIRPPFARHCERWESVVVGQSEELGEKLGKLIS
jgi:hypothetical protein